MQPGSRRHGQPRTATMSPALPFAACCLVLLGGLLAGVEAEAADTCANFQNCSSCIDSPISSQLHCKWINCSKGLNYSCVNATEFNSTEFANCSDILHCVGNYSAVTTVPPLSTTMHTTTITTTIAANVTNSTSPASPSTAPHAATSTSVTTITSTPGANTTVIPPKPSPRKSTFDAASFIGGVVLVLGLQAVIFFLYKFCKSKDRNYHTL
ncbi:sialomucin core protein 24 [Alligator sinensis]|uniref:Sialomucin core protein 24 n=1 Tax=Alligator sinensis TaxID=38654 RepID=A0A1U7SDP7_ALLSI|nr:sialomucin core protein 24 [Alligator sinensis]